MDAVDKITRFDSFETLMEEVHRDREDGHPLRCRYPVRFIILNNFDIFTRFARELSSVGVSVLNLEDMIEDNHERWITTDEIVRKIKEQREPVIITPFSELVRFYKEENFRGLFNEIMLIEDIDRPKKRIYVPLIGLQNRFSSFLNGFARIEESAPVWEYLGDEHKTDVFISSEEDIINIPIQGRGVCCISSLYDWLRFWKNQAPQTKIIVTSGAISRKRKNSEPDNIFTFKDVSNVHQYISLVLDLNIPFSYSETEDGYWKDLLQEIITTGPELFSLNTYINKKFGFTSISPRKILDRWVDKETTAYDRWLIKNYIISSTIIENQPYLSLCLHRCSVLDSSTELIEIIAEYIFYCDQDSLRRKYAPEREKIMRDSSGVFCEVVKDGTKVFTKNRLSEILGTDTDLAIKLCTGTVDFEKELLIEWYANRTKTGIKNEDIKGKYPEFYMYLSDKWANASDENWHTEYLSAYREAKLLDDYTPEIKAYIDEKNKDADSFYSWYHTFKESHERLLEIKKDPLRKPDKVYWFDALGAEYLPYLLSIFGETKDYQVVLAEIARCSIPSATAQNRFQDVEKISDLDDIIHADNYVKHRTMVNELQGVRDKIEEIIRDNSREEHTIAIVSDHGLTCLSRKVDSLKNVEGAEHEGRFIKTDGIGKPSSCSIIHKNENDGKDYEVALKHASLWRKPTHEAHGGCSPEEVLVPFIIISNKKNFKIFYECKLLTREIEKSNPVVTVSVMPQPSEVDLLVDNKKFNMRRKDNKWDANIGGAEEGEHKATIAIQGQICLETTFKVIGTGISGNDFLNF